MKKSVGVLCHGIALSVFLAASFLSCGSQPKSEGEIEELAVKYTLAILPFAGGEGAAKVCI
jgi:hypothetical protein